MIEVQNIAATNIEDEGALGQNPSALPAGLAPGGVLIVAGAWA